MRRFFSYVLLLLFSLNLYSQHSYGYVVLDTEVESPAVVKIKLKTFSKDKKYVDADAQCAAIRTVLFTGIPNTQYRTPLLEVGENTCYDEHPVYFEKLFTYRFLDFIEGYTMLSKFRKADKDKSTIYEVRVKILQLRKDLEKNNIRKRLGI